MYALPSTRLARTYWLLFLVTTDLVASMPLPPLKRTPEEIFGSGFADTAKVLEIQLPLKIASKEDLVAWAKYVMGLMASRINITLSTVHDPQKNSEIIKNSPRIANQSLDPSNRKQNSKFNDNRIDPRIAFGQRKTNANFAGVPESNTRSPQESQGNFNVLGSRIKGADLKNGFAVPGVLKTNADQQLFLPQYPDFGFKPNFNFNENDILDDGNLGTTTPSNVYLPLPVKSESVTFPTERIATRYFFDGVERNVSRNLVVPTQEVSFTTRLPPGFNDAETISPVEFTKFKSQRNPSGFTRPVLTLPFEAVITITREEDGELTTTRTENNNYNTNNNNNYIAVPYRDPPDEFPPYFEKNYTLTNESGQINVVFDDAVRQKETPADVVVDDKRKDEKKKESSKKQKKQKTRKRQSAAVVELLKTLGFLRKKNNTSEDLVAPPSRFEKVPSPQTSSYAAEGTPSAGDERRNETSQAQEIDEGDEEPTYDDDDEEEEEEMGGSIQALIDLLPLAAPILEDLSDPESEIDIAELLEAAIPLLEGLSEGDEDNEPPDIPGILVPILQAFSGGADGQGDSAAVLGPLIQLVAPLIGPIVGPLIGPLSRQSSNAPGEGGSSASTIVSALLGPLSKPTGYGKTSPLSNLIAGVIASLSKELTNGKNGSDLSSLIAAVVSGTISGASASLSGPKDSVYAPTSYGGNGGGGGGGYGGYGPVPAASPNPLTVLGSSFKDIFKAGLKIVSSALSAVTGLLGASSADKPSNNGYGPPPTSYGSPTYASPTNAPYNRVTLQSPKRQSRQ